MNCLSISTNIIICIFEIYLLYDLFRFVFKIRITNKWKQVELAVLLEISMLGINCLGVPILNIVCMVLFTTIWGCIIFEAPLGMSLTYSSLYCIIASVVEAIGGFLYSMAESSKHIDNSFSLSFFLIILLEKVIFFVVIRMWQLASKKYGSIPGKGMLFGFFVLPASTFFVLFGITQFDFTSEMRLQQKIILIIGYTLMLFSNAYVYHLLERFFSMMKKNKILEIMNTKAVIERKHYENLEKLEQERNGYIHDMHKHLSVMAWLIKDKQSDKVLEILEQLDIRVFNMEKKQYCYDRILNAILLDKASEARNEEIEMSISIEPVISMDWIEEIDKITIVGNLLDNAIEASKRCKSEKKIRMDMHRGGKHYLVIIIWNTFFGSLIQVNGDYVTSKADKRNHGIGLKRVREVTEKYGGILKTKVEGNFFGIELYLPIKII